MLLIAVPAVGLLMSGAQEPIALVMAVHLSMLFAVALTCHGELAQSRPPAEQLTEFYVLLGVGGALGGMFNALVAPLVFTQIIEYPVVLVLACLLCASQKTSAAGRGESAIAALMRRISLMDLLYPVMLGLLTVALVAAAQRFGIERSGWQTLVTISLPLLLCYLLSTRPFRFGLGLAALLAVSALTNSEHGANLVVQRTFFGLHRVARLERDAEHGGSTHLTNALYHGTTLHGEQRVDANSGRPIRAKSPMAYYHRDGPLGDIFGAYAADAQRVGVVGLGAGAVAAYASAGQRFDFVEIDPFVAAMAQDERYFSYLSAAKERGVSASVEVADGRLALERIAAPVYDLLVLDAFSSDAIPMHLLTREAFNVYAAALKPDGLLLLHISNRHLDLAPVVARLAADMKMSSAFRTDSVLDRRVHSDSSPHRLSSEWAVLTRSPMRLNRLAAHARGRGWQVFAASDTTSTWTDDYANILQAIVW